MSSASVSQASVLLEAGRRYLQAGFSLIPVSHADKRPREDLLPMDPDTGRGSWKFFQQRQATEDELRYWVERDAQLAVVCGFNGLLVFDFDQTGFAMRWQQEVGSLAENLPMQLTGGLGYQVFARCPNPGTNDKLAWAADPLQTTGRSIAIETRGSGGYAVIAPSLHPSGRSYSWINGDLTSTPEISQAHADALLAAARKLDEAPYTTQQLDAMRQAMSRVSQHRQTLNGSGSIIDEYNKTVSIDDALQSYGYKPCYGSRYARPGGTNPSVVVQNGKSYHHNSNDPLSDGHWHDAFDLYCFYQHGNDPKAASKAAKTWLCLPAISPSIPQNPASSGGNPASSTANPQNSPSILTPLWKPMQSLLAQTFPEPTWVIKDLLSAGVTIVAGRPKRARKSWLMLHLAKAVAGDGQTLGGLDVNQGDVLYLGLEDSDRRLQSRMEKMLAGGPLPATHNFDYATEWPRFDQRGLEHIEIWLQTHANPRLVVIDTLAKVKPPQKVGGSVYTQDYDALQGIMDLSKRFTDTAFVIIHHTRKSTSEDALEEISGSFGLVGGVDDLWVIKRHGEDAVLSAIGRNLPRERELALAWHEDTATWTIEGDAEDYIVSKERQAILEGLADAEPDGASPRDIAELLNTQGANVRALLRKMLRDGQVVLARRGRYRLAEYAQADHSDHSDHNDHNITIEESAAPMQQPIVYEAPSAAQPLGQVPVEQVVVERDALQELLDAGVPWPEAVARLRQTQAISPQPPSSTYDHDRARMFEVQSFVRQGKFKEARKAAQRIRGRKEEMKWRDWIDRVERGQCTPEDTP